MEPVDKVVPSARVNTPPVGIEVTVIVRESPSGSVGAPIPNSAAASSDKAKVVSAPILGALLVFAGGGVGVELPPPPPPHAASANIAKLLKRKFVGPFNSNLLFEFGCSCLRILINWF